MTMYLVIGLSAVILVAVIVLGFRVRSIARQMPGPEERELARIRGEGERAQLEMTRVTSEGLQQLIEAALGHQVPWE